jgi:hypothetical protein
LLIESFLQAFRADNAIYLIGLQWTKGRHGATLHCNVDRFGGQADSCNSQAPHPSPPSKE